MTPPWKGTEISNFKRRIANFSPQNLTETIRSVVPSGTEVNVFPYSIFYPFFEQYLDMVPFALGSLAMSLAAVFVAIAVLSGFNVTASLTIVPIIVLALVNLAGFMRLADIGYGNEMRSRILRTTVNSESRSSLNPVSLVNMVMNVGIAVEFSSHLVQAYSMAADDYPDRLERARCVGD